MTILHHFQDGEQVLLIDQRGKRYLLLLRKGETFHCDRGWIHHETIIGQRFHAHTVGDHHGFLELALFRL